MLVVAKRLYLKKNSKKHINKKRENKEEMKVVHDNAGAFIEKHQWLKLTFN